jgi:hypothetical protein
LKVTTDPALTAALSADSVQLVGVPSPTTCAPAVAAAPIGGVHTAAGAASAEAAADAAPSNRPARSAG